MKTILFLALLVSGTLGGCYSGKEIQVEMINAEVVRIDTIYRYANDQMTQLVWKDEENIEYISYAPIGSNFYVGTRMTILRRR